MMNYTVSLFGHREIGDLLRLESKLAPIIKELIQAKEYVTFLIGRNGEFDEYAASVIKRVRREAVFENNEITLVLPYAVADIPYFERYYDGITIPENLYNAHPKSAITLRNRWMVEHSDLVVVYVEHNSGGAYEAMKYAQKMNKKVINVISYCAESGGLLVGFEV